MQITEQWILAHAPGPAVAEDGRALSEAGCYTGLRRSADGKTCWAECAGSARNPYSVSIDWALSEEEPAYSCSCASPHSPCKHVMGLMYELLDGKTFFIDELPSYVLKVRARHATETERAAERLKRARRHDAVMRDQKLERQIAGIEKAESFSEELLRGGVAALSDRAAQTMRRLAVELGNSALPGARDLLEHIALLEYRMRQDEGDAAQCHADMVRDLAALRALTAQARRYLDEQRRLGSYPLENPVLYEQLGGEWNADELQELGSCRKNARLVQLSFDVTVDEARRVNVERGFWLDLAQGDIVQTRNVRSLKELKYTTGEDSCFDLLEVPLLNEAPTQPCRLVWWDAASPHALTEEERATLPSFASWSLAGVLDAARVMLSKPLLPGAVPAFVRIGAVGCVGGTPVLEDGDGARIVLRDRREDGEALASVFRLTVLPRPPAKDDALFGLVFYDEEDRRLCLHPYSLVTAEEIIRLQF